MHALGIDIGSTTSKLVIVDTERKVIVSTAAAGGAGTSGPLKAVDEAFRKTDLGWNDIAMTIATGYGRLAFAPANKQVSEITCHGVGVHHLLPLARTIIDIGGQDVKALALNNDGNVTRFQMNDKCAAGTGRFLEVMARVFELDVSELGSLSARADSIIEISNTCVVFAESEVISRLAASEKPANVAAGIHQAVARRVASLASRVGIVSDIALTGGVAKNSGIVTALSQVLGQMIVVSPQCQFTGALGAALLALKAAQATDNNKDSKVVAD